MKKLQPYLVCGLFFLLPSLAFGQCANEVSTTFSSGQLVLEYAPGDLPDNLATVTVDFPTVDGTFTVFSLSETTYQTQSTVFSGVTLTGDITFNFSDNSSETCAYENGVRNNPLPVEWESWRISSRGNDIVLNWSTSAELNNAAFVIQRSYDGERFEAIDQIIGAGTTVEENDYQYVDKNIHRTAPVDVLYYRLKQVDTDGQYAFSTTLVYDLERSPTAFSIDKIVRQEEAGQWQIFYTCPPNTRKLLYQVADLRGQILQSGSLYPDSGWQLLELQLSDVEQRQAILVFTLFNGVEVLVEKVSRF